VRASRLKALHHALPHEQQCGREHLDGDLAVERDVVGEVDRRHPPTPNLDQDLVLPHSRGVAARRAAPPPRPGALRLGAGRRGERRPRPRPVHGGCPCRNADRRTPPGRGSHRSAGRRKNGLEVIPAAQHTPTARRLDAPAIIARRAKRARRADQECVHGDTQQDPHEIPGARICRRERDDDVVHDPVEQHTVQRTYTHGFLHSSDQRRANR